METNELAPLPPPPPVRVIAPRAVPPGWPPDVVPRQIIESAHINEIAHSVFLWPGDVQAARHRLTDLGQAVIAPSGAEPGFGVLNVAGDQWDWRVETDGTLRSWTYRSILGAGMVNAQVLQIMPVAGQWAMAVYGDPVGGIQWGIDPSGNLVSNTERSIYNAQNLHMMASGINYAAINPNVGGMMFGAAYGIRWGPSNDWTQGTTDVMLSRYAANRLVISNPVTATMGDLFLGGTYSDQYFLGASQGFAVVIDSVGNAQFAHVNANAIDCVDVNVTHAVTAAQLYGPLRMAGTGNFLEWTAGAIGAVVDTSIARVGPGALQIFGAGGVNGTLNLANLNASGNVTADGLVLSKNYLGALSSDGITRAVLWDKNVAMAATGIVRWSQSDNFYDVSDVQLRRSSAGALELVNEVNGRKIMFQADGGVRFSSASTIRWSNSTNYADPSDASLYRSSGGNGLIVGGPSGGFGSLELLGVYAHASITAPSFNTVDGVGRSGTFTTVDGKTIHVDGGVIVGIT